MATTTKFLSVSGPIEASTVYISNGDSKTAILVARDETVTLPEIVAKTATINMMGDMDIPLTSLFDNMSFTIAKKGVRANLPAMITPGKKSITVKWVQDIIGTSGNVSKQGCMCEMIGYPKTILPEYSVEYGSQSDGEIEYSISYIKLTVGTTVVIELNRMTGTFNINGKSYSDDITEMI